MNDKIIFWQFGREKEDMVLFDPFTLVHFITGLWLASIFSFIGIDPVNNFTFSSLVHLAYEIKDLYQMYKTNGGNESYDYSSRNSYVNSIGDQISSMVASALFIQAFPEKIDINVFAVMTLLMTFSQVVLSSYFGHAEWS
jgi:ABC-type uncharacterized transport system permease subunit